MPGLIETDIARQLHVIVVGAGLAGASGKDGAFEGATGVAYGSGRVTGAVDEVRAPTGDAPAGLWAASPSVI